MTNEVVRILEGVLDLIPDEEAWSPDGWGHDGKRCLIHAADAATSIVYTGELPRDNSPSRFLIPEEVCDYLRRGAEMIEPNIGERQLGAFNDSHSFEDVRLAMKHALSFAQEEDVS